MTKGGRLESSDVPLFGIRHIQTLLFFTGLAVCYGMRVNLSVAIVAMTDKRSPNYIEYSSTEKSLILSSFFWGYVLTQIPGGHFARKLGGKTTLLFSVLISSLMALLTPLSAFMGDWHLPAAARMIQGMSQGVLYPSTHTLLAKWAPKEERALLGTLSYCGGQFGTVTMFAASGFIASSSLGWQSVFYIPGVIGLIWTACWFIWGSSSPSDHKSISLAEKEFIEKKFDDEGNEKEEENVKSEQPHPKIPWCAILTTVPFWALLVVQVSFTWAYWTLLTQIPSYMKSILKFDIKDNALLTSLPYLTMLLLNFVFVGLDTLITKFQWISDTGRRKLFNTIATWIPAAALVGLGFLDANHTQLAIFLLVVAVGFGAAVHLGFMINHIDLSPNFAGILMGITNMVANMTGIVAPITVGAIVTDEENILQWRIAFFIAAGFCFFGNVLFMICGSTKVQPFNEPRQIVSEEMQPMNTEKNKV